MVVAAGARYRRRLERLAERVDLVVGNIIADLPQGDAIVVVHLAEAIEGRADHRFVEALLRVPARLWQQIAGDVLAHELVVRHILVERPNQVVAVAPRVVNVVVPLVAVRFGEADNVHPVPGPALAEVR